MKTIKRQARVYKNGNSLAISFGKNNPLSLNAGDVVDLEITSTKGRFTKVSAPCQGWDQQFKKALALQAESPIDDEYGRLDPDAAIADGLQDTDDDWSHLDDDGN